MKLSGSKGYFAHFRASSIYAKEFSKAVLNGVSQPVPIVYPFGLSQPFLKQSLTAFFTSSGVPEYSTSTGSTLPSIELDKVIISNEQLGYKFKSEQFGDMSADDKNKFLPVAYGKNDFCPDEVKKIFENTLGKAFAQKSEWWKHDPDYAKGFLQLLGTYYKDESFYGEREIRAVFLPAKEPARSKNMTPEVKYFRKSNGLLRPYIEVYFTNMATGELSVPIKAITVGPGGMQEAVYDSIVHRFKYGNKDKLWKYEDDIMCAQLESFIDCFINSDWCASLNSSRKKIAARYIAAKWALESNRISCALNCARNKKFVVDFTAAREDLSQSIFKKKAHEDTAAFLSRNYLSPEGVWIKRSALSYIF